MDANNDEGLLSLITENAVFKTNHYIGIIHHAKYMTRKYIVAAVTTIDYKGYLEENRDFWFYRDYPDRYLQATLADYQLAIMKGRYDKTAMERREPMART